MMKCSVCKQTITDESKMILLNADGDFACGQKCGDQHTKNIEEFFNNIGDNNWYRNNYPELN